MRCRGTKEAERLPAGVVSGRVEREFSWPIEVDCRPSLCRFGTPRRAFPTENSFDAGLAHLFAGSREGRADAVFRHADQRADLVVAFALEMVHPHDLSFGAFEFFQ